MPFTDCQQHEEHFEEQQLCPSDSEQLDLDLEQQKQPIFLSPDSQGTERKFMIKHRVVFVCLRLAVNLMSVVIYFKEISEVVTENEEKSLTENIHYSENHTYSRTLNQKDMD